MAYDSSSQNGEQISAITSLESEFEISALGSLPVNALLRTASMPLPLSLGFYFFLGFPSYPLLPTGIILDLQEPTSEHACCNGSCWPALPLQPFTPRIFLARPCAGHPKPASSCGFCCLSSDVYWTELQVPEGWSFLVLPLPSRSCTELWRGKSRIFHKGLCRLTGFGELVFKSPQLVNLTRGKDDSVSRCLDREIKSG